MILQKRYECPCCDSKKLKKIFTMPYDHERMVSFLLNYYGERIKIFLKDLKDQMYTLQKCIDCQTIFQEFIPTDEFSNKLYEEIISPNKSLKKKLNFPVTQFNTYFNEMIAFENLLKKKSFDIKVLEFGAGWGFWSRLAQSLNFKVNVSEISATRNKFLKDNNLKLINELDKIIRWPKKPSDKEVVVRYLATKFESDKQYTEKKSMAS